MHSDVINSIEPCVLTIAKVCYGRKLISLDMYDDIIQRQDWTKKDKARELLKNINSVISVTSHALKDFVSVLLISGDCDTVALRMQQKLHEF